MRPPTEHGIMFKAPLVRAILDGRKVETRRPARASSISVLDRDTGRQVKRPLGFEGRVRLYGRPSTWRGLAAVDLPSHPELVGVARVQAGDRVWVRETWRQVDEAAPHGRGAPLAYRASDPGAGGQWRPAILMPRWAARLVLPVEAVRFERLSAIDDEGALAEGLGLLMVDELLDEGARAAALAIHREVRRSRRGAFLRMWDSMYGDTADRADADPLVLVYRWRRVDP